MYPPLAHPFSTTPNSPTRSHLSHENDHTPSRMMMISKSAPVVPLSLLHLIEIFRKVSRSASDQLQALKLQHQEGIGSRISAPTSPTQQQHQQTLSSSNSEGNDIHITADIIQPLLDGVTATIINPSPLPIGLTAPLPLPLPANAMANVLQLERELMMNEDDYSKQSTEEQKSDHNSRLPHHGNSGGNLGASGDGTIGATMSMKTNGNLPYDQSG